ncbi:amidohydrolase [Ornithinimicrobium tianjinense]|uniref:Amidohydrolase n=2 Tax=Ornithinimicrobium tianjinense TaxID=1195761 RepID=A0A917F6M1_9MICO|nr:amidohydrolase [Ornithinimicrobium tianjinense]GGF51482.1 amidohydrolase [Ornithinimicrobium tianjinense]
MTIDTANHPRPTATAGGQAPPARTMVERVAHEVDALAEELVELRQAVHAHPELSWHELRTTSMLVDRLTAAGIAHRTLPGSGLVADLGAPEPRFRVALRADLDALPLEEVTGLPFASRTLGVCHACGHDVHTVGLLGAGLALKALEPELVAQGLAVRLLFQPAEETIPGGAHAVMEHGGLDGVDRLYALHCDPSIDVGTIGLRVGPITAASDSVHVTLTGRGGHTSRPHLTQDLTYALGKVVTEVPAVLSRRLDPRSGTTLVWGVVRAGSAPNVIPTQAECIGTVRMLDSETWDSVAPLVEEIVHAVVAPYGVTATVLHTRGVPPVDNDNAAVVAMSRAAMSLLGAGAVLPARQSMGGEDLGWYLTEVPGAMARLGTRTPGGPTYELHQGDLVVDERAVAIAAKVLASSVFTSVGADEHV